MNEYEHICLGKIRKEKNYYWCNVYKVDNEKALLKIGIYEFPFNYPKDYDNDPDLSQIGFPNFFPSQNLKSMDKVHHFEKILSEEKSDYKETKATVWIEKFLKSNDYKIIDNNGKGDCFFYTIIDSKIGDYDIKELRKMISSQISINEFKEKRSLYEMMEKSISDTKELIKKSSSEEKSQLKKELSYENSIFDSVKYMKNIKSLDDLKKYMETSDWWIDESGIEILEKKLNTKFIIFDKQSYLDNDLESVLLCKYGTHITPDNTKEYNPDHYVLLSYENNNHYTLISYNKKTHLSFNELPIEIKNMIVSRCMEGKNIYDLIPEFKALKTSKLSTKKEIINKSSHQDLYNPDVVFVYYINSSDKLPGKGSGEKMENTLVKKYSKLANIKDWRRKLDNDYQHPFILDGHKWNTVTHYIEANRFKPYNDFYLSFSLDSSSEWNKDPEAARSMSKNWKKFNATFKPVDITSIILNKALKEKFKDEKLKELLKDTQDAKLLQFIKGDEPLESTYLMELRKLL